MIPLPPPRHVSARAIKISTAATAADTASSHAETAPLQQGYPSPANHAEVPERRHYKHLAPAKRDPDAATHAVVATAAAAADLTVATRTTAATATATATLTPEQRHKKRRNDVIKIVTGVGAVLLGSYIVPGLMGAAPVWVALAIGAIMLVTGATLWIVFTHRDKHHPKGTPNKEALCRAARAHGMRCRELKGAAGAAARKRLRAFNPEAYDRIMRGEKVNLLNPGPLEAGTGHP